MCRSGGEALLHLSDLSNSNGIFFSSFPSYWLSLQTSLLPQKFIWKLFIFKYISGNELYPIVVGFKPSWKLIRQLLAQSPYPPLPQWNGEEDQK